MAGLVPAMTMSDAQRIARDHRVTTLSRRPGDGGD